MRTQTIDREFSPAEATRISGVSGELQRDWRRRKLLPENASGKWTRFKLEHIVQMLVMKTLADGGFAVSSIKDSVALAILPTLSLIYREPGAIEFPESGVSDSTKNMIINDSFGGVRGR